MTRLRLTVLVASFALASAGPACAGPVDAVVGEVGSSIVTASDIALARALGLFGFSPSETPIARADVDRYDTALVAVLEASRLGIGPTFAFSSTWTADFIPTSAVPMPGVDRTNWSARWASLVSPGMYSAIMGGRFRVS